MKQRRILVSMISIAATLAISTLARAEDGITKDEVKIGMTCGVTGILAPYMKDLQEGIDVATSKINSAGGVNGRKIKHITLDDAYDPVKARENAEKLINQEKVFALVGGAGTASSKAFIPLVVEKGVPFLFPITGGLGYEKVYFSVRVSYLTEAEAMMKFALNEWKDKKFGVFYQDDAFGIAGRNGVAKILADHGKKIEGEGKYDRVKADVSTAVTELMKTKPDVIYMQSLPAQAIDFIKKAGEQGYKPVVLATSIVNPIDMARALGEKANNIYVSQVLPALTDTQQYPIVREYLEAMKAAGKNPNNSTGFEGYIGIKVFAEGLKRAGNDPTRASFISALESIKNYDLGGLKINYSDKNHFGLEQAFFTRIMNGKIESIKR